MRGKLNRWLGLAGLGAGPPTGLLAEVTVRLETTLLGFGMNTHLTTLRVYRRGRGGRNTFPCRVC